MRPAALAALACALCLLAISPAAGATNAVRPCGTSKGWEVTAGNLPPTKCSFARTTDSALKELELAKGPLPSRFTIPVNGQTLTCTTKNSASYAEIRCKNPRRFVLIYKFK